MQNPTLQEVIGLTDAQKRMRTDGIGSSDVPAIAGLNPYRFPIDIYLTKSGPGRMAIPQVEEDFHGQRKQRAGHAFESALLGLYERETGRKVERWQETIPHPEHPWCLATPDGRAPGRIVEVKLVGRYMVDHWKEGNEKIPMVCGVPEYCYAQCQWQMFVTGYTGADLIALLGGTDYEIYPIDYNAAYAEALFDICSVFWHDHVLANVPPPQAEIENRSEYLAKRFPQPTVPLHVLTPDEELEIHPLVETYLDRRQCMEDVKRAMRVAEERLEDAEASIKEIIGPRIGIRGRCGQFEWQTRKGLVSWKSACVAAYGGEPDEHFLTVYRSPATRKFVYRARQDL